MDTRSYFSAINRAAELAPSIELGGASGFIMWAEEVCEILSYIYFRKDYDTVISDLYKEVREFQGITDDDED